jgi:hypothetical protein
MKTNLILLFILTGLFIACNRNKTDSSKVNGNEVQIKNDTISNIYNRYIRLKDALVKSDPKLANTAANELAGVLSTIKGCENSTNTAKEIGSSNDIKLQRTKFVTLSSDIIPMIKDTKLSSGSIFIMYCPMANEGNGGYWMSSNKEVMNPYYGDEMLNCGEVKEEIKTN